MPLFTSLLFLAVASVAHGADLPRWIHPDVATGTSRAVVVGDWPLVHTSQVFGSYDGRLRGNVTTQTQRALTRLATALEPARSGLRQVVKLHVYVTDEAHVSAVESVLATHFGERGPAVAFVVTRLPHEGALVAMDAVATTGFDPGDTVSLVPPAPGAMPPFPIVAVCPAGGRIYVSGQAERADTLAKATRGTLESLAGTLESLNRGRRDVVQLKAFVQPIADAATVQREVATFFAGAGFPKDRPPPLVLVEWRGGQRTPIEIELIASAGSGGTASIDYVTPPAMKSSPVFSRVARITRTPSIYLSGLYASPPAAGAAELPPGEHEVTDIFASLEGILSQSGSDLRHLAKATYYVASDAPSRKLNELRPRYYDPARPPAASKAVVTGVGRPGAGLTLDMIAVPAPDDSATDDPDASPFTAVLDPTVETLLDSVRREHKYTSADFPMSPEAFAAFRHETTKLLIDTLGLAHWVVRGQPGKRSALAERFDDRLLAADTLDGGIRRESHAVTLTETGLVVPMVLYLPAGNGAVPGICTFSGHSRHGLEDLAFNIDSYQRGIALRLARAGFAAIAVEKIDSGLLSRDGASGTDEQAVTSLLLATDHPTRAHQLMACLAATEILALHPRVDPKRVGATGVSLGGWLSVQTALLSDRIQAVADFGVKTLLVPETTTADDFQGIRDPCHILPGTFTLGDRHLLTLAYCPRPMLAGHGRQDAGSQRDAPRHYRQLFAEQYTRLNAADAYEYHIHPAGDVLPETAVINYFRTQFPPTTPADTVAHLQGEMAGELTSGSVILQSRLTAPAIDAEGDVPGADGVARFEIARTDSFENPRRTEWLTAEASSDHVVKVLVDGLTPGTRYHYRLQFGPDRDTLRYGPARTLRTHYAPTEIGEHRFVVVTGMNYHAFHHGYPRRPKYSGADKHLGYPALASMLRLAPDFFVGTGDNVYYDAPRSTSATDARGMRRKWHEQLVQPRYVDLFAHVPTYWEKDDHDYRYDDCDNETDKQPSVRLGIDLFREQIPITDPKDPDAVTYRTHRAGRLLQVWFPENRDYRSPNESPNGPEKTIWGREQKEWLQRTLLESDATFKIIVSPTPMVGPDDRRKRDNHCDLEGFIDEGNAFFAWAAENGFLEKGLYFVCGDRHWQYHSVHPSGFEEYSSGALVDANSRLGVGPGDPQSSDPDGRIRQLYTSREPSGGFLEVAVDFNETSGDAFLHFRFRDENGVLLYADTKARELPR